MSEEQESPKDRAISSGEASRDEAKGKEPVWLTVTQISMLHSESLRLFGGSPGIRDKNLLESALARPQQLYAYGEEVTMFDLAAAYGFGIARNHAFIDGNKRAALSSVRAFLYLNGYLFDAEDTELVTTFEGVAEGSMSQEELSIFIRTNSIPRDQ